MLIDFNSDKRVNDLGKNILLSEYKNQLDELAKMDIDVAILKAQRDNEIFEVLIKNGVVDDSDNPYVDKLIAEIDAKYKKELDSLLSQGSDI